MREGDSLVFSVVLCYRIARYARSRESLSLCAIARESLSLCTIARGYLSLCATEREDLSLSDRECLSVSERVYLSLDRERVSLSPNTHGRESL